MLEAEITLPFLQNFIKSFVQQVEQVKIIDYLIEQAVNYFKKLFLLISFKLIPILIATKTL